MITASLVLYRTSPDVFVHAILSFFESEPNGKLVVIDNSPEPIQCTMFSDNRIRYVHLKENVGFGRAHNHAIKLIGQESKLHLILNPDIRFGPEVLPYIKAEFARDNQIGAIMPKIVYPDGSLQKLCKLLPTPLDLIIRRFCPVAKVRSRRAQNYELHQLTQDRPSEVPSLSGCFLVIRMNLLKQLGGFDERYFMYMEDVDLVRRVGRISRTMYMPAVSVIHAYGKGSYVSKKLLGYHLLSAVKYFSKWGWLIDPERKMRNSAALRLVQCSGKREALNGEFLNYDDPSFSITQAE